MNDNKNSSLHQLVELSYYTLPSIWSKCNNPLHYNPTIVLYQIQLLWLFSGYFVRHPWWFGNFVTPRLKTPWLYPDCFLPGIYCDNSNSQLHGKLLQTGLTVEVTPWRHLLRRLSHQPLLLSFYHFSFGPYTALEGKPGQSEVDWCTKSCYQFGCQSLKL